VTGRFTGLLLIGSLLLGCQPAEPPESHRRTIVALGTLVTVEIVSADERPSERALDKIENYFQDIQREWYAFGDGELGRINAALSRGEAADMSPELAALTRRSLALRDRSGGLFDPTIGMLVELWGFANVEMADRSPPDNLAIQRWQADTQRPGPTLAGRTISAERPLKLTFGAIAKGTALNHACDLLAGMGFENALVDAGGDLKVLGRRGNRRWRIGIKDPHADSILGVIHLESGEAVVTSGDYERYFTHGGQSYHHLLDPASGRPVTHTAGVTVLHNDAELADAAATALMVAGAGRFHEVASRMGIDTAMLVTADGDIIMTPAMTERIREPTRNDAAEAGII